MKTVCFGELMLRLAPEGYLRFSQADRFGATFGGAEANVAVSLANFGAEAEFVTKLPQNDIAGAAINSLRRFGVGVSGIVRGGPRLGLYYLEKGASQRPSKVVYDRAGSSMALADPADFDWEKIFEGAGWFHFTGITPALGDNVAAITMEAAKTAKRMGLTVSADVNYRQNLWSREKAAKVIGELMPFVDVCITNDGQAKDVFGITPTANELFDGVLTPAGYTRIARELCGRYGFSKVAMTLRESISASDNNWAAMMYNGKDSVFSRKYAMHIVDRVGGGDGFGAGLIYALQSGKNDQDALEFAVAAGCLKHTIEGDYNLVSVSEVEQLAGGDGSGRVQR